MKKMLVVLMCSVCFFAGCTFFRHNLDKSAADLKKTDQTIADESKVMVTGALDSLGFAPTNPPTSLAKKLLTRSQELTGLPPMNDRLDIQAILATNTAAIRELENRLRSQEALMEERALLQQRVDELQGRLIDMGTKYEEERNKSVVKRAWSWGIGTFGLAGIIAFIVFCPAIAIPLLGRLLGFLVSAIPSVAGFIGVVSNKVLDTTVKGVSSFKAEIEKRNLPEIKELLKTNLRQAQDESHVDIIESRRLALAKKLVP